MTELENVIKPMLEAILSSSDSYLVDLKVRPNKVEVYADRDPHITIDDCARISRQLEKQLNEKMEFSRQYALEVSSPGMDQPFKVLRQYRKNAGRKVEVVMNSGDKRSGILVEADEQKIILREIVKTNGAQQEISSEIPFTQIRSTQLAFNF